MSEGLYDSVASFKARAYARVGADGLGRHLADRYGVEVVETSELDVGVSRVDLADGRQWVARLFPRDRPLEAVRGDAEILELVAAHGIPAERCVPEPVSEHEGQGVLVTEWVDGVNGRGRENPALFRSLGHLLGQLHAIVPPDGHAATRPAGSWHSLSIAGGGREDDVRHLRTLLADAVSSAPTDQRPAFATLDQALSDLDVGDGLPRVFSHPDYAAPNALLADDGGIVLVDWTAAGTAPRVNSLGLLLSSTGGAGDAIDGVLAGYAAAGQALEPAELDRLEDAVFGFDFVLSCWAIVYFNAPATQVVANAAQSRANARKIAERARQAVRA